MLLADLGAEVIKVEGPRGDDTRTWQPPVRDGVATYYLGHQPQQALDRPGLRRPGRCRRRPRAGRSGRHRDRELPARRAGPVRPGLRDRGRAATRRSSTPRSAASAAARRARALPGYDLIVQAISGLMSLTGDPDGPGYRAGISVFDVMAGLHATIGVLAALHQRHETGRGQHVEVNLLSSALSGLVNHSSAYVAGGTVPYRMGNSHPSLFPYEPLPCADGDLIITAGNDGQFAQAVRGARACPSWSTTRGSPTTRTGRPTGISYGRCWWSGCGRGPSRSGSATSSPPACRADRSTPSTPGWRSPRRSAWTRSSRSVRKDTRCPASGTRSPSPRVAGRVPAAPARAGRARRRDPGLAGGRPTVSER